MVYITSGVSMISISQSLISWTSCLAVLGHRNLQGEKVLNQAACSQTHTPCSLSTTVGPTDTCSICAPTKSDASALSVSRSCMQLHDVTCMGCMGVMQLEELCWPDGQGMHEVGPITDAHRCMECQAHIQHVPCAGNSGIFEVCWSMNGQYIAACFVNSHVCVLDIQSM